MRISKTEKQSRKCELCGVSKSRAVFYLLKPHPAIFNLLVNPQNRIVCKVCAMREEFGTKWKQNKRYKEWKDAK